MLSALTTVVVAALIGSASCFTLGPTTAMTYDRAMTVASTMPVMMTPCPSTLPGDPSLVMSVNVPLKDKASFVKAASAAVADALSKPESYVAVCITDDHDGMSFGGTTDPCAVGCVYSMSVSRDSNPEFISYHR